MRFEIIMFTEKAEAVRFYFKLLGFKEGIKFIINLMICGKEKIYAADFKQSPIENSAQINPELDFRFIETPQQYDEIMADYAAIKGKTLALADRKRIISGEEFLGIIYRNSQLAGWGWVKKGPLQYGTCMLRQSDCVIHKCRTLRHHRKQGVYLTLLTHLQKKLKDKKFSKVYIGAKSFNHASLKGIEKAGFVFVEECDLGSFFSRLCHHLLHKSPKVMCSVNKK